jgi:hypothetical protein
MRRVALVLLAALLLAAGCKSGKAPSARYTAFDNIIDHAKPLAMGDENNIHVFCGQQNWAGLESLIRGSIEREVSLVYQEKYFNLIFSDIKEVDKLFSYRNLLFIGSLEGTDPVSNHIKGSLTGDLVNRVKQSGGDLMISKNRFTRDQIILHLVAIDNPRLKTLAEAQSNNIFTQFLDRYTSRLAYQTYQMKVIPPSFFEPYPFSMQIPENYQLYSNDKANRFLSFLSRSRMETREVPDKFVSVYYEDMPENKVDEEWMIKTRSHIANIHFDGDSLNAQTMRTEIFKFASYDGLRLTGTWINPKRHVGGPYQSFAFWDAKSKRAYLTDIMVFYPAGEKLPVLMELFMIASTLKLK